MLVQHLLHRRGESLSNGWNSNATANKGNPTQQLRFFVSLTGCGRTALHIPNVAFFRIVLRLPTDEGYTRDVFRMTRCVQVVPPHRFEGNFL